MKIVKELPKSILHSLFLHFAPSSFLLKNKKTLPVIVSLTSIPSRISTLHLVIKSLFNQSYLPSKIVLWLHEDLKNNLPKSLNKLQSALFEIKYSPLTCSHKKLIHTLENYPESIIITCDDDLIYRTELVKNLYDEHLKYPKDIIANRTNQIKLDKNNEYRPFSQWKLKDVEINQKALCPIGAWGILYPPKSLPSEVFNQELFLKLTPKADDLWFKTMSLINGTTSRRSQNTPKSPIPIWGTQKIALKNDNIKNNKNDTQWLAVSKYFNLKELLK
ncbi:glycosyl transferase [uncultured Algibacter sp.]|uniref:glycosyl transferase n=1 Tax=uncultured Algibacter sp. TaxID=298659 RepID=UPI00262A8086|nr:glycosyl transferase [uncultured Algibacter sp.]